MTDILRLSFLPLDDGIAYRTVFVIVSGSNARKRFWSHLINSEWQEINHMCQWGADSNPWVRYRPPRPPNPTNRGVEKPPLKLQSNGWRSTKCQQSTFSGSKCMPLAIVQLSPKSQMSERKSSIICAAIVVMTLSISQLRDGGAYHFFDAILISSA